MTDKELAEFGERLYEAVLLTPLPAGTILGLATAIRYNAPWSELPRSLRFAVFKIAAVCLGEPADQQGEQAAPNGEAPASTKPVPPQHADAPSSDSKPAVGATGTTASAPTEQETAPAAVDDDAAASAA